MSKIDDIFKDGLSDKGLKYSESDWKAMSALLDQEASFFIRYRWWFRSSIALMVAGFIAWVCFYDFDIDGQEKITTKKQDEQKQQVLKQESHKDDSDKFSTIDAEDHDEVRPDLVQETESSQESLINSDETVRFRKSNDVEDYVMIEKSPEKRSYFSKLLYQKNKTDKYQTELEGNDKVGKKSITKLDELFIQKDIVLAKNETAIKSISNLMDFDKIKFKMSELDSRDICGFMYDINPNFKAIGILKSPYSKWSFYASPYIKSIQHQTTIRLNNLVDESNHKSNESAMRSIGYGLNLAAQKKRWKFTSGIGVITLQQKTNYILSSIEKTYITKKKLLNRNYIISPRGKSIALIGDVVVDSTISRLQRDLCVDCLSNFDYWTVPFQVDYQTVPKNRILFFGGLGINIDILKKTNGYYTANADNGILGVVELDENLLNNTLIRLSGSVGLRYGLTKLWGIRSSYQYGYGINSMLKSYDQLPQTNAIQFGLEYKIR